MEGEYVVSQHAMLALTNILLRKEVPHFIKDRRILGIAVIGFLNSCFFKKGNECE
jgi:hypothetical protein